MPRRPSKPVQDESDIVLQELYGVHGFESGSAQPNFGVIELPLSVGSFRNTHEQEVKDGRLILRPIVEQVISALTVYNLAWHFGYFEWAQQNLDRLMRDTKMKITYESFHGNFYEAIAHFAKYQFEVQRIRPLRRALLDAQHPIYFYCIPAKMLTTDPITGQLRNLDLEDEILTVLPCSPSVAIHYGLEETMIRLLAPHVGFVIRRRCSYGAIRSPQRLLVVLDSWKEYLSQKDLALLLDQIQASKPELLPSEHKRRLLTA